MTIRPFLLAWLPLLALSIFFVGCEQPVNTAPSPGMGDAYPAPLNDPQISILSPELRPWLAFHPAIVVDDGERPMQVQVPVRNVTTHKYLIDYRILFYDLNGMELEPKMGWTMAPLLPKEVLRLSAKAMSTDAVNYRLEIKWAR